MLSDEIMSLFTRHARYGLRSDVARACGLTPQSVGEWARGKATPSPEHWPAVERYFELPEGRLAELAHRDNISAATTPAGPVTTQQPALTDPVAELRALIAEQAAQLAALTERVTELGAEVMRWRRAAPSDAAGSRRAQP